MISPFTAIEDLFLAKPVNGHKMTLATELLNASKARLVAKPLNDFVIRLNQKFYLFLCIQLGLNQRCSFEIAL